MDIKIKRRHGVSFSPVTTPPGVGRPTASPTRLGGVSPAPWTPPQSGGQPGDDRANVGENFRRFCAAMGADPGALVKNHQIHSNLVRRVTRADIRTPAAPGVFEADGLITGSRGVPDHFLRGLHPHFALRSPPPLHRRRHAGWRGTASGIAARAAGKMV